MKKKFIRLIPLTLLILTSCWSKPSSESNSPTVLASTSVLADIARNIAGERLRVESLLPISADPHAYQAKPSDIKIIAESDLLILNGMDYEHFIEPLLENAGGERIVVEATHGLTPSEAHADETESNSNHVHEAGNPHLWLDPNLVITYVENIRDGFIQLDRDGEDVYNANAENYINQLKELDMWIVEQVNQLPAEKRLLVTNHESLTYFAERYGFEIVDSILPSFSSEASPSAQEIASAIDAIKSSGAPAIFLGEIENADLANQIASETGVKVVNNLYLESLTDGEPAETYIDMMKHNILEIITALK